MTAHRALVTLVLLVAMGTASCGMDLHTSGADDEPGGEAAARSHAGRTGVVLLSLHGSEPTTSGSFSATTDWDLHWTYDCSGRGVAGTLVVQSGSTETPTRLDQGDPIQGRGSGIAHYHPGTYTIKVDSQCQWHIEAAAP